MRILPKFSSLNNRASGSGLSDDLIRQEAEIGGQLFGPVPKNHNRQFFCLDEHTWVWHESWSDKTGSHSLMTRYEIRPNGIFKVQNGGSYQGLTGNEIKNLVRAINLYGDKLITKYDHELQTA